MPEQILAESVTFRKLIGYIGEHIAESYLRKEGFDAHVFGDSGIGTRIGDVFIRRQWFHNNGRCEGHWETIGIEVKTTTTDKIRLNLSQRQKLSYNRYRLPVLLIKILGIQSSVIEYEVMEKPFNWINSQKFASWKGEPKYYDQHSPSSCHKVRDHTINIVNDAENERRLEKQRYLKSIKRIRKELEYIGYSKYIEAGIIKKEELE